MKRILALLLVLAMLLCVTACSEEGTTTRKKRTTEQEVTTTTTTTEVGDTDEPQEQASQPLLYKVTSENGGTVWLFGSVHVGVEEMYPLPDYVWDAFEQADALAVEFDITAPENEPSMAMIQQMMYTDGTTIADHIDPALYAEAKEILEEYRLYGTYLDNFVPYLWGNFIDNALVEDWGFDAELGVDMQLLERAAQDGKRILEVESMESQWQMTVDFSPALQEMLLQSSVEMYREADKAKAQLQAMVRAWCAGDEAAFKQSMDEESDEPLTAEEQALLDEYNLAMTGTRDVTMTDFAEQCLKDGEQVFLCVGAAHIVPDGAMVDLLLERGYTVTRVR